MQTQRLLSPTKMLYSFRSPAPEYRDGQVPHCSHAQYKAAQYEEAVPVVQCEACRGAAWGTIPRASVVRVREVCVFVCFVLGEEGTSTCSFTSSWSWTHLGATTVPPCISTMIAARRENPPPEGMKNCNQYIVQVCV